jgi:endonuclease I
VVCSRAVLKRRFFLLLWLAGQCLSSADPPPHYYASAEGQSGADLRRALHLIVHNHAVIPYTSSTRTDTWDALWILDQDPANTNNVLGLYSRLSEPKSSMGLTTGWDREHQWCNSYGIDSKGPAYSDLHNLRAEDYNVNSARGNKYYDDSSPANPNYKNPASSEAPLASTDVYSWDPPDVVKGDIARALFYMTVRYTGDATNEPALRLTDDTALITSATNFMGRYSTLLKWSFADPVDDAERRRNDLVYAYQANRNPFVDHPEWVSRALLPALTLTAQGGNIVLSWPAEFPNAKVDLADARPSSWTTLTNLPTLASNACVLTLPAPAGNRFYRLRL